MLAVELYIISVTMEYRRMEREYISYDLNPGYPHSWTCNPHFWTGNLPF